MIRRLSQYDTNIIQLKEDCKAREIREHNLLGIIATFTNSSKIIEKMINVQKPFGDKVKLGFDSSSQSNMKLTEQVDLSNNEGLKSIFVKVEDNSSDLSMLATKSETSCLNSNPKGELIQKVEVAPRRNNIPNNHPSTKSIIQGNTSSKMTRSYPTKSKNVGSYFK